MRLSCVSLLLVATALSSRSAAADNSSSALDELKEGYTLKQQGDCRGAVAHFTRSFELDAKPKALLNLSDCEKQMGDLVAGQDHATYGRELAQRQNDTELTAAADEQLAAIDKRLPRLTIKLSPGAPSGSTVSRDGVVVELASLGVTVGINPGTHAIVVAAPGHVDRRFVVTITEGAREQIDAEPGPLLAMDRAASPHVERSQKVMMLTYGAFGVGAVGLTIGIAAGLAAGSKHDTLVNECPGNGCQPSAQGDLDGFHSLKTVSTVGYVVGAAGLIGGVALWLWLPQDGTNGPTARLWIGPASTGIVGAF
jgi:hypothetical protein